MAEYHGLGGSASNAATILSNEPKDKTSLYRMNIDVQHANYR